MADMRTLLASAPKFELAPQARDGFDALMSHVPPADAVHHERSAVAGIPGAWCRPAGAARDAAILYLHGGGYVLGSADAYVNLVGQMASRAAVDAFVPDYRLAPEHPFPAAVDDALEAYDGLVAMGYRRIALVGDSAGGGLALALLSRLCEIVRSTGTAAPACAAVISPWIDLSLAGESMNSRAQHDPLLSREALGKAASLYLDDKAANPQDPRASALFARLDGLPPVRLHVGADEVLLDDSIRYARALEAAGGIAEAHVWEGMLHVFPASLQTLTAAREALDDVGEFLSRMLRTG